MPTAFRAFLKKFNKHFIMREIMANYFFLINSMLTAFAMLNIIIQFGIYLDMLPPAMMNNMPFLIMMYVME